MTVHDPPGVALASEDHGDPQRDRTHVPTTGQPRLGPLNLDDVAKVRCAVSRHLLETKYGAVANLGGCRLLPPCRLLPVRDAEGQADSRA